MIPIGLQLFSVRGECQKDLPATIAAAADMGYQGVEPWGYRGEEVAWLGRPAKELRTILDDSAQRCCGMHLATDALMGENLSRTIELNQELGNRFLIIAADKPRMSSAEGIAELAGILDAAAERLQPLGMRAGYHAHPFDFERIGERTAWEILFSTVRPDVIMQLDTGNCARGGADPVAVLERFPGRSASIHLRDYAGDQTPILGEGEADWTEIFGLCETTGATEWYVVEQGGSDGIGLDIPRACLQALKRMGK